MSERRADLLFVQLVCVAVFQATAARDLISKVCSSSGEYTRAMILMRSPSQVIAAELPVFVFVCLGYDHVGTLQASLGPILD